MYFDSFAEFLQMGSHGFYVWLAYGTTFVVLLWVWLSALYDFRRESMRLSQQHALAVRSGESKTQEKDGSDEPQT